MTQPVAESLPTMPTPPSSDLPSQPVANPRPWPRSALYALLAVLLMLAGVWLYARSRSAFPFFGTAYPDTPLATPLSGTADTGQPFTFVPASGKVTALFFGFTHCPNICPLSLAHLSKVQSSLTEQQQHDFQILMVSVDPQRDTPQRMNSYVNYFGKGMGLTIAKPQLSEAVKPYGVGYQYVDKRGPDSYQVNHTTATYLIDASGHLQVVWDYSQLPQTQRILADVRHVLENPR